MALFESIKDPVDLKNIDTKDIPAVCEELRRFLIDNVSVTGGHLASNLGVVELSVALHMEFDSARDRIVFDVGHQSYVHKILTGRGGEFKTLRMLNGLSGFPKPSESGYDAFVAGHASTSVSAALGMARARTLMGDDYGVVSVIGDGAFTGGLAYEGLNDAGQSGEAIIIILNDNGMSITKNVGSMAAYLARLRARPSYFKFKNAYRAFMMHMPGGKAVYRFTHGIKKALKDVILPAGIFESMGFHYYGPANGHDVREIRHLLSVAKGLKAPVIVHINTVKGKGYSYSEENPAVFHGVSGFDISSGKARSAPSETFSSVFGAELVSFAESEPGICAITAAMPDGTGLSEFSEAFPERFFDVGIAEGHAVTMSAGMAKQGMIPVCAVYSTFLQRSYDMLIHDVALQKLHVVFAVDRAGLVGEDGETHQGVFDVGFLTQIPGFTVLCPSNFAELRSMLRSAVFKIDGPVAVRYPRGGEGRIKEDYSPHMSAVLCEGSDITLISYGTLINVAAEAAEKLSRMGMSAEVLKLCSIAPLDVDVALRSVGKTGVMIVLEDCLRAGSVGERLEAALCESGIRADVALLNTGGEFVKHGSVNELRALCGLDEDGVIRAALRLLSREKYEKKA